MEGEDVFLGTTGKDLEEDPFDSVDGENFGNDIRGDAAKVGTNFFGEEEAALEKSSVIALKKALL